MTRLTARRVRRLRALARDRWDGRKVIEALRDVQSIDIEMSGEIPPGREDHR